MEILAIIVFIVLLPIIGIIENRRKEENKRRAELIAVEKKQKNEKVLSIMNKRNLDYGKLTKEIIIYKSNYNPEKRLKNIFVYEDSKTIFIDGNEYSFNEIVSCTVHNKLVPGKILNSTTIPDKSEMATQELLYGWGKTYNVKTHTNYQHSPDKEYNIVYIGINNLSNPLIVLDLGSNSSTANEICILLNLIIQSNYQTNIKQ